MQQYDDNKGKRRFLDIENMNENDVSEYYLQNLKLKEEEKQNRKVELKKRIRQNNSYEWILAIKLKDGKIIGKIEVLEMGNKTAFVTINLPNKSWKIKYGTEALDQFIKICKENDYFSKVELEKNNSIVERYMKEHDKSSYEIELNVA